MTELSRDLRKYLTLRNELREFEQRLKDLYEIKTSVFQGMVVVLEEEIERLKADAVSNREQAVKLESRIRQLSKEKEELERKIRYCLPLYDQWVKVPKPNGFFLVKKTKGGGVDSFIVIDEYNEKEERIIR